MQAELIYEQTQTAIRALLGADREGLDPVRLLVIGASSSEIAGGTIGHDSTYELGEAVSRAALDLSREKGFDVAFQCCEHLNRALVMERAAAEARGLEIVCVVPQPKAGGSLATSAWRAMTDPVAVLSVSADAGLDIGLTLIGMHLRRVAVPVRLGIDRIGSAVVSAARTRPMLIGGERAHYR
ncbi:MAG: TIGR01440 family protein [Clostridia bacterium]|nr:TIGR01440 family protein [Clostridia bacterium]